jgi:hypothetical protein
MEEKKEEAGTIGWKTVSCCLIYLPAKHTGHDQRRLPTRASANMQHTCWWRRDDWATISEKCLPPRNGRLLRGHGFDESAAQERMPFELRFLSLSHLLCVPFSCISFHQDPSLKILDLGKSRAGFF